jgi:nucleotide-binding universal stress UspA family protein
MSGTVFVVVLTGWLAIGVLLSFVLGRRGHDGFAWLLLGAMLGPLAVALAVDAWRHGEELQRETVVRSPVTTDAAAVDVLIGFDGSPESRAALRSAIDLLGARLGRLTLATVIPFDGGLINERQARAALEAEAAGLAWLAPELEIVRGNPAHALDAAAIEGGYDVLAVGTMGAGRAHLFGSTASHLARHSKVPVLMTGSGDPAA